ncbi:tetratricopeptide repeat protein [Burkholderia guangdongensis]|uniref:tetratricopeptide repeat protein n=1 Tax=Burkholderia guangdongensis TaxID=1792500 RepID=UPI001FE39FC4|nr:tetratricopeptide repeat protein [Burkholderia guangdongensis]
MGRREPASRVAAMLRRAGGGVLAIALGVASLASNVARAQAPAQASAQAQPIDPGFAQIIDDDLQAQATLEMNAGHRQRALALLREVVRRDPHQAGARLDIAILYCELGERELSLDTLSQIEHDYSVPPAIEKLIVAYKANACVADASRPSLVASVGLGATSNANFGPSNSIVTFAPGAPVSSLPLLPEYVQRSDQYVDASLQGALPIAALPGFELDARLAQRQYRSVHAFDQHVLTLGAVDQKALAGGELDNQLIADVLWLGQRDYQRDARWETTYWLAPFALRSLVARAGLDASATTFQYPGNELYNATRVELRAAFQAHLGDRASMLLFVGPAWDIPHRDRPGGTRRGYSAWLGLGYELPKGQLEAVLQQRELNDAGVYDPVFFGGVTQHQTVRSASLRYTVPLQHRWSLYAQLSLQRVADSISLFSYTQREASTGLVWKY